MIALKTAVNEVRQELGMQENRSLDTIESFKEEYRLCTKQLTESLEAVKKEQEDKMDTIINDVKAVKACTDTALQQGEKLSKSFEVMSKRVNDHDERLGGVEENVAKLQEAVGQRPKEYNCYVKEMPLNLTIKDLHEAWQSIEDYLLEELAPKNMLTFFEKRGIIAVEECKDMCELKRSEVVEKLLQRIKANLPDAFLCLLHALDETKQDVIVQGMWKRIKETLCLQSKLHNQETNGVTCKGPNDLIKLLGSVRPDLLNVHEERLRINCKAANLKFHGSTPADGNCFFHAVADQLSLLGHSVQSATDLRRELVNFLRTHETIEGPDGIVDLKNSVEKDWTTYCNDMMNDSEWVDATAVFAMARMLKRDIMVVTSSPGENGHFIQWIVGVPNFKNRPLLLGHVFESHYESLQIDDDQKQIISETDGLRHLKRMARYSLKLELSRDGDPLYVTEMKASSHFDKGRIVLDYDIESQCLHWKHGSIIVYLRPLRRHAKETLPFFCQHGGMKQFVLDLLKKKDIFSSLPEGEISVCIQVCCYDEDSASEDEGGQQHGDFTQITEKDPDSYTDTDNPQVIKQNLLLQYGCIVEEIEPLQFQDTFVGREIWDKSFFEKLKMTDRRRARAAEFLNQVLDKGSTALSALVHALRNSGNDDIAKRLSSVRKISSEFMGQVDDDMIKVVKEDSTTQFQEDMIWSCHLTVAVRKIDEQMASNVKVRCPKCSKTFNSQPAMEAHKRDKHCPRRSLSSSGTQPSTWLSTVYQPKVDPSLCEPPIQVECVCGKKFQNEKYLQQHRSDKSSKKFGCGKCCKSFDFEDDLEDHHKKKHSTADAANKPSQTVVGLKPAPVIEGDLFLTLSDHLKKIYYKQTTAPFKCPCGKEYQELTSFQQHLTGKQKTAKPYSCKVCCKSYHSEQAVEDHYRVKHAGHGYNCDHDQLTPSVNVAENIQGNKTSGITISPGVVPEVFKCSCGKVFSNEGELKQHAKTKKTNTKPFPCTYCCESFDCSKDVQSHVQKKHNDLKILADSFRNVRVDTNKVSSNGKLDDGDRQEGKSWTCACGRTFEKEDQLTQHRAAKKEKAKPFPCQQCCHSYKNQECLDAHRSSQHGNTFQLPRPISSSSSSVGVQPMSPVINKTYRCLQCIRQFASSDALIAHEKEKFHDNSDVRGNKQNSMQRYLENYYRIKSDVKPEDKNASFEFVRSKILKILSDVRKQEGGEIFKCELRNAGSNASELKIGKADQFDFNIPIDVKVLEVKRTGTVPYIFKDKEKQTGEGPLSKNMNVKRELKYEPGGKYPVPRDYAVLVVDKSASPTLNELCVENHLIAHHLQQRLYSCIRNVVKGMKDIDLNAEAHGPAITMNIHPPGGHHISVDLTMVIDWKDITVKEYDWPRPETQKHLSSKVIGTILAAGCQLTPKGDEFWNISFPNCESILMKEIDGPNECRKMCHKLLKTFFQTWKSRSKTGYKSISSFIFKHLTFWMNEKKLEPDYWIQSNLSTCFLDTLKELLKSLDSKRLINYFIPNENILGIKDLTEVNELAEEVKKKIRELENINC